MERLAEALGCTVREAFPEVYSEKVDVPTVNITDTQPISTAKLAMQYGMTTREFNQALFRAGIQIQRSDGTWVVAGNYADMVTYKPVKTEHGTVRLFAMWTLTARKVIQSLLPLQSAHCDSQKTSASRRDESESQTKTITNFQKSLDVKNNSCCNEHEEYFTEGVEMQNVQLVNARKASNMTQVEVASRCGVTVRAYQHYEAGQQTPSVTTAIRIADALGVEDVRALFG